MTIQDEPRFGFRGLLLDPVRCFIPKENVLRIIDCMAMLKINKLHFHLTDDNGWRIEIKKYPKLIEVGSKRKCSGLGWEWENDQFDNIPQAGHYTQEDIKEIVAYAKKLNITIVPEIEILTHSSAAIASYPQLGTTKKQIEVECRMGVFSEIIDVSDDFAIQFMHDVLDEVMALFPGEYIHIGGDEAHGNHWANSQSIRSLKNSLGITENFELQIWYFNQINKYLNENQKGIDKATKEMEKKRTYIAIDLKSFYASVECKERNRDPLTTNLVVADKSRTEKTICLAVSPALKCYGIPGRARLFEVVQKVKEANSARRWKAPNRTFIGSSDDSTELNINPALEIDYIVAPPRMALYLEYSTRIYSIYLKYIAPEDIFPYSIDEVFMDVTDYLHTYNMTARELAMTMIQDVLKTTGITATAGIGTNMYLCKIAMDIVAKHIKADKDGVRIAELDEMSYRRKLWSHRPLTDFWRVGKGYAKKLEEYGLYTMGDIARCSIGKENELYNEDLLYKLFGVNAELLIDHAWGYEPCTMEMVKAYKPETNSVCSGQVLHCPYDFEKAKLVVKEMTDQMVLDLVDKKLVTDQIVLTVGYDIENLNNADRKKQYHGEVTIDRYGRRIPKHAHGTTNLKRQTSSTKMIMDAVIKLYDRIVDRNLLIRRINITANRLVDESSVKKEEVYEQLDLFTDYVAQRKKQEEEEAALNREKRMQEAMLSIKKKFGKNAVLKGMNLQEGATARDRNEQIGGHKA